MEALGRHGAGKNGRMPGQWRNCRPMSLIWVMAAMDAGSRSTDLAFLLGNVLARLRESEINQKGKARKLWDIEEGKGI